MLYELSQRRDVQRLEASGNWSQSLKRAPLSGDYQLLFRSLKFQGVRKPLSNNSRAFFVFVEQYRAFYFMIEVV